MHILDYDEFNIYTTPTDVENYIESLINEGIEIKEEIYKNSTRNSLNIAIMPTASTSQILGNNECIEPFTSNIYSRKTLSGEFVLTNKHLIKELIDLKLWSDDIRKKIIINNGSVQNIEEIPSDIRYRYRTVWEMKMKDIIDMSADRAPFICQTQSLNLFFKDIKSKCSVKEREKLNNFFTRVLEEGPRHKK